MTTTTERSIGVLLVLSLAVVAAAQGTAWAGAQPSSEEAAIRQRIEDFLDRLGNRQIDTLEADFMPNAVIVVSRQTKEGFQNSLQTLSEWLAGLRKNPNAPKFREPISNVHVTLDSGHLAYLRADFQVVRDGKILSSGVDQFTLVRQPGGWKIVAVAYTSIPAVMP
jgi:hypothetical protein